MTHTIRFPVGDWSDDGHGKCEYYNVRSSHSAEHLREVHFKAPEVVGFEIGKICSDYEDSQLSKDFIDKLTATGMDPNNYGEEYEGSYSMYPDGIIKLWLDILIYIDADLELEIIKPPEAEPINFYGFDEKNRHLDTPGYGLFY